MKEFSSIYYSPTPREKFFDQIGKTAHTTSALALYMIAIPTATALALAEATIQYAKKLVIKTGTRQTVFRFRPTPGSSSVTEKDCL